MPMIIDEWVAILRLDRKICRIVGPFPTEEQANLWLDGIRALETGEIWELCEIEDVETAPPSWCND